MRTATLLVLLLQACSVERASFRSTDAVDGGVASEGTDAGDDGALAIVVSATSLTVAEGTSERLDVRLSRAPEAAVAVAVVSSSDGKLGLSPTELSFDAETWQTPQVVSLAGKLDDDTLDEGVLLLLSSTAIDDSLPIDVLVVDDDGLALALSPTALDVSEGASAQVAVRLTAQPADRVVIAVGSSAPEAAVAPATLAFTPANWDTPQLVTVTGQQDADTTAESISVTLSAAGIATATLPTSIADDDVLGIAVSTTSLGLAEGGSTSVTVALTQAPPGEVVVALATGQAAVAGISRTSMVFSTTTWDDGQAVTVSAPADLDVEPGSTTLTLSAAGLATRSVAVAVTDDDRQAIVATPASITVAEGGSTTAGVRLAFRPADDVVVNVASLAPGVATASPATLSFSPANYAANQTVTITGVDDANAADGATALRLEAVALGLSTDAPIAVDDDEVLTLELSTTAIALGESGSATFQVRLGAAPQATTVVSVTSGDLSAAAVSPSALSFTTASWSSFQTVTVAGVADGDLAAESVAVSVSATGLASRTVTASVADDDSQAIVVTTSSLNVGEAGTGFVGVHLAYQPSGPVTVAVASANNAVATASPGSLTFSAANYASDQNVVIAGVNDAGTSNGSTSVSLTAAGATGASIAVSVTDDDAIGIEVNTTNIALGEAGSGTFTVRLTAEPVATTVVTIASLDAGAATASPSSLTFTTASWAIAQTVTVSGVDDPDAANESVSVTASAAGLTSRTIVAAVTDNDVLSVVASVGELSLGEAGSATFTLRMTAQPTATTTISITSSDPGAAAVSPGTVAFTTSNWSVPQLVTVSGVNDADALHESVTITVSEPTLGSGSGIATVYDDDILAASTGGVTMVEGGSATFTLWLTAPPAGSTPVSITSGDLSVVTVSPGIVTFTAGNWSVPQEITVFGVSDGDAVDDITTITVAGPGLTGGVGSATVLDDD